MAMQEKLKNEPMFVYIAVRKLFARGKSKYFRVYPSKLYFLTILLNDLYTSSSCSQQLNLNSHSFKYNGNFFFFTQ
ncbi:MAG: hypothetical protein Q8O99_07840, partial [bacterium]|nr:hypothetical protein [bacterium]